MADSVLIAAAESVTRLEDVAGKVLVAGSHGGVIAAWYGAKAGARALVLNDAGVGKDRAGIAGLVYLEAIGMAAAAVDCMSARIGDGADMLARGVISHVNAYAALCGVVAGQSCREAAGRMRAASPPRSGPPPYAEGRWRVAGKRPEAGGPPEVWALDSLGKLEPEDAGRILVIGSHGALLGGRRESALAVGAAAAVFNDAGGLREIVRGLLENLPEAERLGAAARSRLLQDHTYMHRLRQLLLDQPRPIISP